MLRIALVFGLAAFAAGCSAHAGARIDVGPGVEEPDDHPVVLAQAGPRGPANGRLSAGEKAQLDALLAEERAATLGPRPARQTDRGVRRDFMPVPMGCRERRVVVPGNPHEGIPRRTHVRVRCGGDPPGPAEE